MVTIFFIFGELDEEDTELDPRDLEEDDLDRLLNTSVRKKSPSILWTKSLTKNSMP